MKLEIESMPITLQHDPRLDFQSGGTKNIVTKEGQPRFAPMRKIFNFEMLKNYPISDGF